VLLIGHVQPATHPRTMCKTTLKAFDRLPVGKKSLERLF
jgi:hypothetical protein